MTAGAWTYALDPDPVAQGSQGEVYFGRRSDGLAVAVKIAAPTERANRALKQEIALLVAMADLPGVMRCLDQVAFGERVGMVMPRYGRHLGQWLEQVVTRPDADTLANVLETCAALADVLARVHRTEFEGGTVVHRDVKPENIFLAEDGTPVLGDFGGAMAVDGLKAVELALFGTPLWAPLDQLLPGMAIPDPTWDTYALCVVLYAAITGARPAYQADPLELLTPAGRQLWAIARQAIHTTDSGERAGAQRQFAVMRKGSSAHDLVDPVGRAALVEGDREALRDGLRRLCELAHTPERARDRLERTLWNVLARGLSPVSHPSPPNRYRDAAELGEELASLAQLAHTHGAALIRGEPQGAATEPQPPPRFGGPARPADTPVPRIAIRARDTREAATRTSLSRSNAPLALALVAIAAALGAVAAFAWWNRDSVALGLRALLPRAAIVAIPAGDGVPAFRLDATEVSNAAWATCVTAGACPAVPEAPASLPVVGISRADALGYCAFAGGRLPTEPEWRRAAGPGPFPWGTDAPTCDRAAAAGCDGLVAVGSGLAGASPYGVTELAGNAAEWTDDGKRGAVLGGSIESPASELGSASRQVPPEGARPRLAGVRCAYGAGP